MYKPLITGLCLALSANTAMAMTEGATAQGQPFLTGGVGHAERMELQAQRSQFNLRVLTAAKGSGAYLADATLVITDSAGRTVLNTPTDGPWLYVSLNPGQYRVQVHYEGQTMQQTTHIAGAPRELFFYFQEGVERLPEGASE